MPNSFNNRQTGLKKLKKLGLQQPGFHNSKQRLCMTSSIFSCQTTKKNKLQEFGNNIAHLVTLLTNVDQEPEPHQPPSIPPNSGARCHRRTKIHSRRHGGLLCA